MDSGCSIIQTVSYCLSITPVVKQQTVAVVCYSVILFSLGSTDSVRSMILSINLSSSMKLSVVLSRSGSTDCGSQ